MQSGRSHPKKQQKLPFQCPVNYSKDYCILSRTILNKAGLVNSGLNIKITMMNRFNKSDDKGECEHAKVNNQQSHKLHLVSSAIDINDLSIDRS